MNIRVEELADGAMIAGKVGDEDVLLARRGDEFFAVSAHCTHYHGPLAEGLMVGETVRCPWHHACFDLRTGSAIGAPAMRPLKTYEVVREGDVVRVTVYPEDGRVTAVVTLVRDDVSLTVEAAMERSESDILGVVQRAF